MNDGVLVVQFGALEQASADIGRALSKLQADLAQLEVDAGNLMSTWDGAARAAYEAQQRTWTEAAGRLSEILLDIQRALDRSAADYRDTEKKATNLFS